MRRELRNVLPTYRTIVLSSLALLLLSAQDKPPAPPDFPGLDKIEERQEWVAPGESPPFKTSAHVTLVGVAKQCSETLAAAQWRQDIVLQIDSNAHFDNCSFKGSLRYIEELEHDLDVLDLPQHADSRDLTVAVVLLGRALHGIQDFYSHSNYVELMAKKGSAFDETLVIPVWTPDGRKQVLALAKQGLVSGRVWWDYPKRCAASGPTHAALAKDSDDMPSGKKRIEQWKRNGYRAAFELADLATRQFLRYAYERWPALKTACGPVVVYLPPMDHRPDPPSKPAASVNPLTLPACRLDRRTEPIVRKTLQHVLEAAKRRKFAVPATIAINPETPAPGVLSLQMVGDMPVGMADEDGCPMEDEEPPFPRTFDELSIRGLCQAVSSDPALIRCSGEEMLRIGSKEQWNSKPSAAIAYIFAHELSHIVHSDRSHFNAASRVIDLSRPASEKRRLLYQMCETADASRLADRKQEERADQEALLILRDLVQRSPYRDLASLEGAAISQNAMSLERAAMSAHRWLRELREDAPLPARILDGDFSTTDEKALRAIARGVLCDIEQTTEGRITLPLSANSTHPSETDRLARAHDMLAELQPEVPRVEGSVVQQSEQILAGLEQFQKHIAGENAMFLANVGRCICDQVDEDRSALCKGVAIVPPVK